MFSSFPCVCVRGSIISSTLHNERKNWALCNRKPPCTTIILCINEKKGRNVEKKRNPITEPCVAIHIYNEHLNTILCRAVSRRARLMQIEITKLLESFKQWHIRIRIFVHSHLHVYISALSCGFYCVVLFGLRAIDWEWCWNNFKSTEELRQFHLPYGKKICTNTESSTFMHE